MSAFQKYPSGKKLNPFWILLILFLPLKSLCQENYDEISVTINVERIGSVEIPALIHEEKAFLPIKELFDFLKIKNSVSDNMDHVEGYFINPKSTYLIDHIKNKIVFEEKILNLKAGDLIKTETALYMRSSIFCDVFGLTCTFNFRSLSINISTKADLPAIREMQQEQMRKNVVQLQGKRSADTVIKRDYPIFRLGMADWSLLSTKEITGNGFTRIGLNLGATIAGGEADVFLSYNSNQVLRQNKQLWRWKLVNNENPMIRQVILGNIYAQTTASVYGAVKGISISNTPTTYRKSFGTYRLSSNTQPNWMVELYVNNVLVNYTKADASGFFTFDVPLVYGSSAVKLRFYGPWGEEKTKEEFISIPFNFLPLHQFEYTASAGVIDDGEKSKVGRLNMNYGLSNHLTIGGGIEYLSSVASGKSMPFVTSSLRLGSNILITAEHTLGVRTKGVLNYRLPSNFYFEANYVKYVKGQTAIRAGQKSLNNYMEERKAVLSLPIRAGKISAFTRLSYNQLILTNMKYTTGEFLLSANIGGVNTSFTTSAVYFNTRTPSLYSNLALNYSIAKGIRVIPQVQYDYKQNNFSILKCEVEKNLFNKGFLTVSYEKNVVQQTNYVSVGMRYNFSFAQTSFSVTKSNDAIATIQTARGSILYNDNLNRVTLSDQTNVGRGGLILIPFLDLNGNGKRDKGEERIPGLKLRINGGKISHNKKDSSVTVSGLEAFNTYTIELNKNSFDNVAWQIKKPTMSVSAEPNYFKKIEIPVIVVGEVSGTVVMKTANGENGLGRIIVNIFDSKKNLVAHVLSEQDGYFVYTGLIPGKYTAEIDKAQMKNLNMRTLNQLNFTITENRDGDIIEGLKLTCQQFNNTR